MSADPSGRFADLAEVSAAVAAETGRSEKVRLLSEFLKRCSADDRDIAVALLSGTPRQGRIGVGYAMVRDAAPTGAERVEPSAAPLTIQDVDRALETIAATTGPGSTSARRLQLGRIFARATPAEAEFLARVLTGALRQGAGKELMVDAVALATGTDVERLRRARMRGAEVGRAVRGGRADAVELFRPVLPMLAGNADDLAGALARNAPALVEAKADGARVQVHRRDGEVRVFTRSGNDVTATVPEIVQAVGGILGGDLILDGEALVWTDGRPRPFQITMRRVGSSASAEDRQALPLRVFFFDVLYADGELLDLPLAERRARLLELVPERHLLPAVERVEAADSASEEKRVAAVETSPAEALLHTAQEAGFEGVMVKALESPYTAGRRGRAWLKVKPVHTLDLVVLAAEWGSGRRTGWLSNLHLGAREQGTGGFVMLGKTFKGLTDELLAWQTERLQEIEVRRTGHTVWVRPELVVEIAFDSVQRSRRYPGGMTLRFARVKRYRPDKRAQDADTIIDVRRIFEAAADPDAYDAPDPQGDLFD